MIYVDIFNKGTVKTVFRNLFNLFHLHATLLPLVHLEKPLFSWESQCFKRVRSFHELCVCFESVSRSGSAYYSLNDNTC